MSTPEVVREVQSLETYNPLAKQKAAAKLSRIPVKVVPGEILKKPDWIRVKAGSPSTRFYEIKQILRENKLNTVCEEASCPNIGECFGKGTATFMIMGDKCTRRCPFCDVGHGRPDPLDKDEPLNLARTIAALKLKYVVITSVDRDDLRDGGSGHFVECIQRIRELSPSTQIEVLVPDFRGRDDRALEILKKPDWIRVKAGSPSTRFYEIKQILRENKLNTVCEEASCPNIGECFGKGTATFMIMGDKCTRRCPFCDVGHGRPDPLDADEPLNLAKTIAALKLKYVVITSVDRDDLRDGGSGHFVECISKIRELSPATTIEILVPDFRGRDDRALEILKAAPPDVMNHNLETTARLYKEARPGSDYQFSLNLLKKFKALHPNVPTKSGIMVGLGETDEEILQVMRDMRAHDINMLTIGQYLAPSMSHLPVRRYVHPDTFKMFEAEAYKMGFTHAAVGAMVRSSYHADEQAHAAGVPDKPVSTAQNQAWPA